ncbi:hypothetical protein BFW01_g9913 [Lasiodiplodia theobromae]|nr:hypothetical protein BFW01_g9913 [Lasiodiplodia theobromae]
MKIGDVITSSLIGCGTVLFPCVRERRRAQAERRREYAANFTLLKLENEKRVNQLSAFSAQQQKQQQQTPPPNYQETEAMREKSMDGDDNDGGRMERVTEEEEEARTDDDDGKQARYRGVRRSMPVSRRDWAAVTTVPTPALGSTTTSPVVT